jgi:hypothetical protein
LFSVFCPYQIDGTLSKESEVSPLTGALPPGFRLEGVCAEAAGGEVVFSDAAGVEGFFSGAGEAVGVIAGGNSTENSCSNNNLPLLLKT